ncbi:MAG: hypothetical protein KDC92_13180 [Bacteroidetes bacterium]|nr:hypothetical protein [Bacteroidota bacterium]
MELDKTTILPIVERLTKAFQAAQHKATLAVNRELLALYNYMGKQISVEANTANWGDKALENIDQQLQRHFDGLRDFSAQNLKKLLVFLRNLSK